MLNDVLWKTRTTECQRIERRRDENTKKEAKKFPKIPFLSWRTMTEPPLQHLRSIQQHGPDGFGLTNYMLRPEDGRLSYIYIPIYRCIGPSRRSRRLIAYSDLSLSLSPALWLSWGTISWFRWIRAFLLVQGSRMFLGMFFIFFSTYVIPVTWLFLYFLFDLCSLMTWLACLFPHKLNTGHWLFILESFQGLPPPPFPVILVVWRFSTFTV